MIIFSIFLGHQNPGPVNKYAGLGLVFLAVHDALSSDEVETRHLDKEWNIYGREEKKGGTD